MERIMGILHEGIEEEGGVMTCRFEGVVVEEVGVMRELAERIREW